MATTGATLPGTGGSFSSGNWSDNDWTSAGNITADDTSYASVTAATYDAPDQTYVLRASNFNFSAIPDGSTINGVQVTVRAWYANGAASIDLVRLHNGTALAGDNKAGPNALTTSEATYTYGTSTDGWNASLTAAIVKASGFGVGIGMLATEANADVFVDWVKVEVWYTPPAPTLTGGSSTASVGAVGKRLAKSVAGTAATASVGTVAGRQGYRVALAGVTATASIGTLGQKQSKAITGTAAVANAGTPVPAHQKALQGVSATAEVGSPTPEIQAGVEAVLTGAAATAAAGSFSPAHAKPVDGVTATASTGSLSLGIEVPLVGVTAIGGVGGLSTGAEKARVAQAYFELPASVERARVAQAYFELPASAEKARVAQAYFELPEAREQLRGKFLRRGRTRIFRQDVENLPIKDKKDLLRRVERALDALKKDNDPAIAKRAERVRKGLVEADSVKRRSLLRLNFEVVLGQLEVVSWALDAYEEQRNRRRRDDEEFLVVMMAARHRGLI